LASNENPFQCKKIIFLETILHKSIRRNNAIINIQSGRMRYSKNVGSHFKRAKSIKSKYLLYRSALHATLMLQKGFVGFYKFSQIFSHFFAKTFLHTGALVSEPGILLIFVYFLIILPRLPRSRRSTSVIKVLDLT
jgi:uncharacterized membrane protein